MYGLPENFDCSFFSGRIVEMLCVNANQIYLHFDRDVTLTLEGKYSLQKVDIALLKLVEVPYVEPDLFKLIEQAVSRVVARTDGTLSLTFANGFTLNCYDETNLYESYRIRNGDQITIV